MNLYITYEIKSNQIYTGKGFTVRNSFFGVVNLTPNSDPHKYSHFGYAILFDVSGTFSSPNRRFGKNVIIFGVDMSSSVDFDDRKVYLNSR